MQIGVDRPMTCRRDHWRCACVATAVKMHNPMLLSTPDHRSRFSENLGGFTGIRGIRVQF